MMISTAVHYGQFLASMLARLSSPAYPALSGLTVRSLDDPAIALLDGWAVTGDVVTFYTERIANEGYLRTATETASLRLLGRLVGYAPRPGVAAVTYLAYTLDRDPTGRDTTVTIPYGSRAQSVPAPGQDAQAYETAEDLTARWSWNDLKVRLRRPIQLRQAELPDRAELPLAGTAHQLKPGDRLLFVFGTGSGQQELAVVREAEVDQVAGVTVVRFTVSPRPTPALALAEFADGEGDGDGIPPSLVALSRVLDPLRKPPSRPPVSSRRLRRDPDQLFAADSDFLPQLLAAVDPRLRDNLYPAWHQVDVTHPLALTGLQALGVVAVPFGATAPLKPDLVGGRVVGQTEWPLTGTQEMRLVIGYNDEGAPANGDFFYTEQSGGNWRDTEDLTLSHWFPEAGSFGPFVGHVELVRPGPVSTVAESGGPAPEPAPAAEPAEDGVRITFYRGGQVLREVFLSNLRADQSIHLTVTGDVTLDKSLPPDPPTENQHGIRIDVRRAGNSVTLTFSLAFAQVSQNILALDAVYDGIAVGSWVAVERPRKGLDPANGGIGGDRSLARVLTTVQEVRTVSLAAFGISGKVTQLVLKDKWLDDLDTSLAHIRDATAYARGTALSLATEPVSGDVSGRQIELDQLYDGFAAGRWVVVTGERTDIPGVAGVPATELVMVAAVHQTLDPDRPGDTVHTTLVLSDPLAYTYRPDTVHLYGNVVRATQGSTRDEPIGSGDASRAGQTFTLFQTPLTWLAADTPLGAASTLEVRIDGVLWHEADSFAGRGPDERVYVTATGDDGRTRVTFGDGVHGARLPTGSENVRAHYRVGLGQAGNLKAGQVTQLATRPLGVSGVTNPLPATGGADPDDARQARRGIPIAVTALDRLVGVPDYENLTRARAGIGRASARLLYDGSRQVVHVTVAGAGDIPLAEDSDILTNLRASLSTFGDPQLPVAVAVRDAVLLLVAASIKVAPDHAFELVEPKVRAALLDRLGFAARELGQPAYLSEVAAAAQAVPGVDYLDVDIFTGVCADLTPRQLAERLRTLGPPQSVVPARLATYDPVRRMVRPAQLVTLSATLPDTLILREARS